MTFLTTRFRLPRSLTPKELDKLSRLSSEYGIRSFSFEGSELVIEYDASRFNEAEVLAAILKAGIAGEPKQPIPPGSFDTKGEFRDFAWPTEGVTPVNQKQK